MSYYKRNGYQVVPSASSSLGSGPRLSVAWAEYYEEKTSGRPKPDWSPKTAHGRQAVFDEFVEIVTDVKVNQVTRDVIQTYLQKVAKLPKNRRKKYGDRPVPELLKLDLDQSLLPSSRTNREKLIQIGSFFKWCRVSKGYSDNDPTEGLSVRTTSRSYSPFTNADLENLF